MELTQSNTLWQIKNMLNVLFLVDDEEHRINMKKFPNIPTVPEITVILFSNFNNWNTLTSHVFHLNDSILYCSSKYFKIKKVIILT